MDILEQFLNKISYKFEKGYPDLDNPKDVTLLEKLTGINLFEEKDAKEAIDILKKELNLTNDNFKKQSSSTYKLLVPSSERTEYIQKIIDLDGFEYDPNLKGSSIGGIIFNNIKFLIKPLSMQGRASAGLENEDTLSDALKEYLEDSPKDIVFTSPSTTYTAKNVKEVIDAGYDVKGGKKADLILIGDKKYPISIKKDNASFWESADTRYGNIVKSLSDKISNGDFAPTLIFKPFIDKLGNKKEGINIMYNSETDQKVTGVIVTDLPEQDEEKIIFGTDNAIVIYKTFVPSDITNEGDIINVKVSKIIEDMEDVEKFNLSPILNIRHDSTRTSTGGLRAVVQSENSVYKDGKLTGDKIEISYNEIK